MKKTDSKSHKEEKPNVSDSSNGDGAQSADSDQDFDPTAEMLVNDFDDEHTLDEEESLENAESFTNELDDLQREGEMPLSDLLAMYGYDSDKAPAKNGSSSNAKGATSSNSAAMVKENDTSKGDSPPSTPKEIPMEPTPSPPVVVKEDEEDETDISVPVGRAAMPTCSRPLLRSVVCHASESSDTGTDDDYSPDDDWRKVSAKTIQVGSDFQAAIPEGLCKYDDAPAYENEDRLLWDPSKLSDEHIEEYLRQSQQPVCTFGHPVNALPTGSHVRDDEQALFLLLQCGQNTEEALRRRRMQPVHPADTMSLWSEDECRSFENGLKTYGKDFYLIQQNKVRTRAVGELVQFYYLWKKTERHDVFASKHRLEKKKYALHPGTTDYMDRFLEEQENPPSNRDRSSSPSTHSLIFGDNRKRTPASSPPATATRNETPTNLTGPQNNPNFLDTLYTASADKTTPHRQSPSKLLQSSNSECGKEFLNGEDKHSREKCLSTEVPHTVGNSSSQVFREKSPLNPPNEALSCSRHSAENSRLHEAHVDSRFETCREVTSIE